MRIAGVVVGTALASTGDVWALQGLDSQVVPQSFMTGSRTWLVIGVVALVGDLALARWSSSRR